MNMVNGFDLITEIIQNCLDKENCENGLLSDVKTIISTYSTKKTVNTPCVWVTQHPTLAVDKANIRQNIRVTTPVQFTCAVYDKDEKIAEKKSQNLTSRVGISVLRNYLRVQKELEVPRFIQFINFNTYLPEGEVPIAGKSQSLPATALVLDIVYPLDWIQCCKNKQKKKNEV